MQVSRDQISLQEIENEIAVLGGLLERTLQRRVTRLEFCEKMQQIPISEAFRPLVEAFIAMHLADAEYILAEQTQISRQIQALRAMCDQMSSLIQMPRM